tara:strand:+ start:2066 stop:2290 length:225 start_codon:yes stop_codon:yes gene_type:complete
MVNLQIGDLVQFTVPRSNPLIKGWVYKDLQKNINIIPPHTYALVTDIRGASIDVFVPRLNMQTSGWVGDVIKKV